MNLYNYGYAMSYALLYVHREYYYSSLLCLCFDSLLYCEPSFQGSSTKEQELCSTQQTALVGLEHPLKTPRLQCSRSVRSIFFYSVFLDSPHSVQLSCLLLVWWQGEHNLYSVTRVGLLGSRRSFPSHQPVIQIGGHKNVHSIQAQFDYKKYLLKNSNML